MSDPAHKILLVEDDPQVRRLLRTTLRGHGYQILEAKSGREGLDLAAQYLPDLWVLDLGLPDLDGVEVMIELRQWSKAPVLILSVRDDEQQKVQALDAGADDYLTKPFGVAELLARIRVLLRRAAQTAQPSGQAVFEAGPLRVDLETREVTVEGRVVHLTPIEYRLLALLVKHAGKVLTHRTLIAEVWGPRASSESYALRVHMTHLRRKLGSQGAAARMISTETGVGYRLVC